PLISTCWAGLPRSLELEDSILHALDFVKRFLTNFSEIFCGGQVLIVAEFQAEKIPAEKFPAEKFPAEKFPAEKFLPEVSPVQPEGSPLLPEGAGGENSCLNSLPESS
ncbi:MAG: hypothetical protein IJ520_09925, partial [Synergistaceae bacterium]|nr:hypothetical protein [Synergistaceae bacterium]